MTQGNSALIVQAEASVAAGASLTANQNVLSTPGFTVTGALLWPSWRDPPEGAPEADIGETGDVQNHWRYRRGVLNVAVSPPVWSTAEQITEARYRHDRQHPGTPLPNVDVDLFHANAELNFNDYAVLRPFYTPAAEADDPSGEACGTGVPEAGGDTRLVEVYIGTRSTDARGRFEFTGLAPGDYVLCLRGRFSFIENPSPGGRVTGAPAHQHNGVPTSPLGGLRGAHWLHLKLRLSAEGAVEVVSVTTGQGGATTESTLTTERLLEPGQTADDITVNTPYRFYALPLVVASNAGQWSACAERIRRAFGVTAEQARAAMLTTPVLDLNALYRWQCAGAAGSGPTPAVVAQDAPTDELLKRTLLVSGPVASQALSMAYDHAFWHFATATATDKTRAPTVPLGVAGFFSEANHLYGQATKTKDTYGRFALRFVAPELDGRDIRELKIRLILWGSQVNFINISHDRFNQALREALLRFKRDRDLFRTRINLANGDPDEQRCVIVTILDKETYDALDAAVPSLRINDVSSMDDPVNNNIALLPPDGYSRIVCYAGEIARRRIAPGRTLCVDGHSSYRTLDYNRKVYRDKPNLRWRLASGAAAQTITHGGFTTTISGVTGQDGSNHAAGDQVTITPNTIRYGEPRGTYRSNKTEAEGGDHWAPDYSKHTTGQALDFCLDRDHGITGHGGGANGVNQQIQRDTDALKLFGASRGAHVDNRLWLEPGYANPGTTWGTKAWIHMDSGELPVDREEFVLTDADIDGPRWDATLIVRGRVTRGGAARLGARVELLDGATMVAETYANRNGDYSLRVRAQAVRNAGYSVRATYAVQYIYQPPPAIPVPDVVSEPVAVAFAYPGEEVTANLTLPAP